MAPGHAGTRAGGVALTAALALGVAGCDASTSGTAATTSTAASPVASPSTAPSAGRAMSMPPAASAASPTASPSGHAARVRTIRVEITPQGVTPSRRMVTVPAGTHLRLVTSSYRPLEVHLHGYDIEAEVAPGRPGVVDVPSLRRGSYEFEAHDEAVGQLLVIRVP